MTLNWPSPNKPKEYVESQGDEMVKQHNARVRSWAKSQGDLWVLETYSFTKGEYSRDGVHYDDKNIGLAQALLNYILRLQEVGRLKALPEARADDASTYKIGDPTKVGIRVYKGPVSPSEFEQSVVP